MNRPDHPLARARKDAGLTQEQLAARAGVSVKTVGSAEAGVSPRRATQAVLAATLGRHARELWPEQHQQHRRAA